MSLCVCWTAKENEDLLHISRRNNFMRSKGVAFGSMH
jgi:hypothetical protein